MIGLAPDRCKAGQSADPWLPATTEAASTPGRHENPVNPGAICHVRPAHSAGKAAEAVWLPRVRVAAKRGQNEVTFTFPTVRPDQALVVGEATAPFSGGMPAAQRREARGDAQSI